MHGGFYYSRDGRSFSTTFSNPQILLTPKGVDDTKATIIIQNWWKKRQVVFKNTKRRNASIIIQKWWKKIRTYNYYYLFIDNSNFYIEELYNRLLTVLIPGIEYICIKNVSTFPKCIFIKSNLHKAMLDNEIHHVLRFVGYNYQFVLNKN